jgi:NAD(P)H-hydrate epimerase
LGVAGTGDVLSGVVAAQLATQPDPLTAAATGVLLHALAGELAASADRGLLAGEVARAIPAAVERCRLLTA